MLTFAHKSNSYLVYVFYSPYLICTVSAQWYVEYKENQKYVIHIVLQKEGSTGHCCANRSIGWCLVRQYPCIWQFSDLFYFVPCTLHIGARWLFAPGLLMHQKIKAKIGKAYGTVPFTHTHKIASNCLFCAEMEGEWIHTESCILNKVISITRVSDSITRFYNLLTPLISQQALPKRWTVVNTDIENSILTLHKKSITLTCSRI